MMAWLSASSVCGPKFIVPRTSRLTLSPVRPSCVYFMVSKPTSWSALYARGGRSVAGEGAGVHGQVGHGARQIDVVAEVHPRPRDVVAVLRVGVDEAAALVGVDDDVEREL